MPKMGDLVDGRELVVQKETEVDVDGEEMVQQKDFEVTETNSEFKKLSFGGHWFYTGRRMTVDEFVASPECLPVGFSPTDRSLIIDYLMGKVRNGPLPLIEITEEPNVFNCHPQDLSKNHNLVAGRQAMYFFTRRNKMDLEEKIFLKEDNVDGFWKISEADIPIKDKEENGGRIIGFKNRMVFCTSTKFDFYVGGHTTIPVHWSMSEYRLNEEEGSVSSTIELDRWIICKIFIDQDLAEDDPFYWEERYHSGEDDQDEYIS